MNKRSEGDFPVGCFAAASIAPIVLILILTGIPSTTTPSAEFEQARREFRALKGRWDIEAGAVSLSSNSKDRWKGPAGGQIIEMGKRALPFVMDEIEKGDFFFNIAADRITGVRIGTNGPLMSEQERSKAWLSWWEKAKTEPEWNIFLPRK